MQEAIRSMPEWIASVRIATEPVTAPANSLSAIRRVLETIETAAARVRSRPPGSDRAASARSPERTGSRPPRREPAVGDRVLLVVAELGHRAALAVGHEHRVVAKAARAGALGGHRAGAAAVEQRLLAAGRDVGDHAHVLEPAAGRRLAAQLREVLAVARDRARE